MFKNECLITLFRTFAEKPDSSCRYSEFPLQFFRNPQYTMEQLTEEEIKRAHELDAKWKKAVSDCMAGKISDDEYDAITNEYKAFISMLLKKYDGIDN